jgi:hypothetical protein
MKESTCNYCATFEDDMAWLCGWLDGCIIGCIFGCSENIDKHSETNMIVEFFSGATHGFGEGEKIGNMDK